MPTKINVCLNASCSSYGAQSLVRDIEELANGECDVEEWGCLGRCGKGPNVELAFSSGEKRIVEGVVDWKNTLALVRDEAECEVPSKVKKLCKMKYEIRRAEDPAKRNEKLQKAFDFLGGEDTTAAAAEPMLLGSLLILRSKALLKDQLADALKDAQKAAELAPTWAQSQLALAAALEASGAQSCPRHRQRHQQGLCQTRPYSARAEGQGRTSSPSRSGGHGGGNLASCSSIAEKEADGEESVSSQGQS